VRYIHLSEVLSILGDKNRLRILNLLNKQELCVCCIEEVLGMAQPNTSKHLNRLQHFGIIKCRKIAQWCFYSINDNFRNQYDDLFCFLNSQWKKNRQYVDDLYKLDNLFEMNDGCKKLLQNLKNIF
jgi:ArsR family transcriptional regulator, arsenate/arsenite/antimonite-responsive transcriptional repressor